MEQDHAIRFRKARQALSDGDRSPFIGLLDGDIEWWDTGADQPIQGRAAVEARIAELARHDLSEEVHDLFANDEHIVALIHTSLRAGTETVDYGTAEVYHLSDKGLITKRQAFAQDTSAIRRLLDG